MIAIRREIIFGRHRLLLGQNIFPAPAKLAEQRSLRDIGKRDRQLLYVRLLMQDGADMAYERASSIA